MKLVLAAGRHDAGLRRRLLRPAEWQRRGGGDGKRRSPRSAREAAALRRRAGRARRTRRRDRAAPACAASYLRRQLEALRARLDMLAGKQAHLRRGVAGALRRGGAALTPRRLRRPSLAELGAGCCPGTGPLAERVEAFRAAVRHPARPARRRVPRRHRRVPAPHRRAPRAAGRRELHRRVRDRQAVERLQLVQGQASSSLIQVNTELPIFIDRAIDLACHEGYPGHHVYNALLEKHLVRDRGWVEFTVYPLFSPQSLIAEGTANFGIEVAFPGEERVGVRARRALPARRARPGAGRGVLPRQQAPPAALLRRQRGGAPLPATARSTPRPPATGWCATP